MWPAEASRQQSTSWNRSLEAVRHEFVGKLEQALALQQDLQQLLTLEAGLQAQSAMLAERLATVEEQSARWGLQELYGPMVT